MASTLPHKDDMSPTYCPEKAQRLTESATPKRTMSPRRLAVIFSLCFLVAYGLAAAISPRYRVPCHYGHHEQVPEGVASEPQGEAAESGLSTLLNSVSPDSLHRMLHDYFPDRYQHGVYETDRQAVEAVHADNPAIVASIAKIAKRQNNSTTTTTSPPRTSTTSEKPTSTNKPTSSEESKTSTSKPPSSTTKAPETTDSTTTSASQTRRSSSLVTATLTSTQPNGDVTVVTATSFVEVGPSATATTGGGSLQTGNAAPGGPVPPPVWAGVILGGLLLI